MIYRLQMLRAWAAMFVMMFHYIGGLHDLPAHGVLSAIFSIGWAGVDVFFVISGYIITKTYHESVISPGRFFLRRCFRIYSGYWLILGLWLLWHLFLGMSTERYNIISSMLLIPQPKRYALFGVAWTLSHELLFYALFALAMAIPRKKYIFYLGLPLAAIMFATYSIEKTSIFHSPIDWVINPYLLEFLAGSALYFIPTQHGSKMLLFALFWIACIGWIDLSLFDRTLIQPYQRIPRVLLMLPGVLMLVGWAVSKNPSPNNWISKGLVAIGNASYMLYLVHGPVIKLIQLRGLESVIAIPLAITLSLVLHKYAEWPLYKFLSRRARQATVVART